MEKHEQLLKLENFKMRATARNFLGMRPMLGNQNALSKQQSQDQRKIQLLNQRVNYCLDKNSILIEQNNRLRARIIKLEDRNKMLYEENQTLESTLKQLTPENPVLNQQPPSPDPSNYEGSPDPLPDQFYFDGQMISGLPRQLSSEELRERGYYSKLQQ
tara:strand:+ start:2360 stop:2836 length:477 start_codon:yes stop_codon:yes gene_type:complete